MAYPCIRPTSLAKLSSPSERDSECSVDRGERSLQAETSFETVICKLGQRTRERVHLLPHPFPKYS
jgi:hypothetical protein